MAATKSPAIAKKLFREAVGLVRGAQEEARFAWFPNETLDETVAWLDQYGMTMLDHVTVDEAASPEFVKAVKEKGAGNANAPSPHDLCAWLLSRGYVDDMERSLTCKKIGRAIYELTAAAALAGIASERAVSAKVGRSAIVDLARRAANVRHQPNRERKAKLQEWYLTSPRRFRSIEAAAAAAIKVFPVTHRTASEWIAEARRKTRSARRP